MVNLGITFCGFLVVLLSASIAEAAKDLRDPKKLPPNTARGFTMEEAKLHPKKPKMNKRHRAALNLPERFESAKQWPQCKSITTIRRQGSCGNCWAVAASAVLSDRWCIVTGKNEYFSALQTSGCSFPDYNTTENCNRGGNSPQAFRQAVLYGIATGGERKSSEGCVPYDVAEDQKTISCSKACTNSKYGPKMAADNEAHKIDSYWVDFNSDMRNQAEIDANVLAMKEDLFKNGPITAAIQIYVDFSMWTKDKGPYEVIPGYSQPTTTFHAARIVGWDKTAEGIPYWIVANSWGEEWGLNGYYWMRMGQNTAGIEGQIAAPIIKLDTKCDTKTFCTSPLDQAVRMDYKNLSSPILLFQGECALQVEIKGDKLAAVGKAEPFASKILGAPKSPIVTTRLETSNGVLLLVNNAGESGYNCTQAKKSTKFVCETHTSSLKAEAFTVTTTGKYYKYDGNPETLWGGSAVKGSEGSSDSKLGDVLSKSIMKTVIAFQDIDGTKMFVFGKGPLGKPLMGVMSYPKDDGTKVQWLTKPTPAGNLLAC